MKKLLILTVFAGASFLSVAQSVDKASCDKTACGPEGTKTTEAKVITNLRSDLEAVLAKMSQSSLSFDKNVSTMKIAKGRTDDESLLFISQAVASIRHELTNKVEASKLVASLKQYAPSVASNKQQMMASLKKEIEILTNQAEKL